MSTDQGFVGFWGVLEATFGAQDPARAKIYRTVLQQIADSDLAAAAVRCVVECRAFPVPRDILDRVPGSLSVQSAAAAAWSRVLTSATNGPTAYSPATGTSPTGADLDDDCLSAIGGRGGLCNLATAQDDAQQVGFIRRDFLVSYEARRQCEAAGLLPDGTNPPELPGARDEVRSLSAALAADMHVPAEISGDEAFEERRRTMLERLAKRRGVA